MFILMLRTIKEREIFLWFMMSCRYTVSNKKIVNMLKVESMDISLLYKTGGSYSAYMLTQELIHLSLQSAFFFFLGMMM